MQAFRGLFHSEKLSRKQGLCIDKVQKAAIPLFGGLTVFCLLGHIPNPLFEEHHWRGGYAFLRNADGIMPATLKAFAVCNAFYKPTIVFLLRIENLYYIKVKRTAKSGEFECIAVSGIPLKYANDVRPVL